MASNSFGSLFKITTFGESHGKMIGVVIDGCPANIPITLEEIQKALDQRAPGRSPYTSPRRESDSAEIQSGVFEGHTTGAPLCITIANCDADSSHYEQMKAVLRPGHAGFTYEKKYGIFDFRGGGRASARETACRVAAGAVAKKWLSHMGIYPHAYLKKVGSIEVALDCSDVVALVHATESSSIFCPDAQKEGLIKELLDQVKSDGDSIGGVVAFLAYGVPESLGDPVYEKIEAKLASAMMSIPASRGFEIGDGFLAATMRGSCHNDGFQKRAGKIVTVTNHAGGVLGGITNGMPLLGSVAFKPTSSIKIMQKTLDQNGNEVEWQLPEWARHDPCVAIRAVPIVEAMLSLVLADAILMNRCVPA